MSEESQPNQEENPGEPTELAPSTPPPNNWEDSFELARPSDEHSIEIFSEEPKSNRAHPAIIWLKAGTPIFILLLFFFLKYQPSGKAIDYWGSLKGRTDPESLSGVEPEIESPERLDKATTDFLAKLEGLRLQNKWSEIIAAIEQQPDEKIKNHPVVQALDAIAKNRQGLRNTQLEIKLRDMESRFAASSNDYPDLLHELRLARVEQILSRSQTPEILFYNLDEIYRLLGPSAETNRDVVIRLRASQVLENQGDNLVAKADGYLKNDTVLLTEARQYYQSALRFLVVKDAWPNLEPLSPQSKTRIERLLEKMRQANRMLHGVALPMSGNDSSTWSGKKGSPVHDDPISR